MKQNLAVELDSALTPMCPANPITVVHNRDTTPAYAISTMIKAVSDTRAIGFSRPTNYAIIES